MRLAHRVVLLLVVLAAAGCGGEGGGDGDDASAPPPRAPGEVRIAVAEDIWPLTGQGPTSKAFAAGEVNVGVYEPLTSLGPDFTIRPGLAERWEMTGVATWRFHLRRGVRFHDGRPFTADDVVWSWTSRQLLPSAVTSTLTGVTKIDDFTVEFVLATPNRRLPEQLAHPEGPIVPQGGHNDSTPPVGTGPYKVVEYRPRQRVVVERFDDYWGDKATVARITFLFMPDERDRVAALGSGDVDLITNLPYDSVAEVGADARLQVLRAPIGATQSLSFPTTDPVEREVRHAVALSVDRSAYVREVLEGNGEPGRWLSPPAVLGEAAAAVEPPTYDPARARRILEEAGWAAGSDGIRAKGTRRLTLTLIGGPTVPEAGLRFVQEQLRLVGIEVAVKRAWDRVTYEDYRQKGYDLDLTMSNQNDGNPAFLPSGRAGEQQVDLALNAVDREAAQHVAADMTRTVVHEEVTVVPLAHVSRIYAMRRGVDLSPVHPSAINQPWTALAVRS